MSTRSSHEATEPRSHEESQGVALRMMDRPPARLTIRPATKHDAVPLGFFFDTLLRKDYFMRRGQLAEMLSGTRHQVFVAEIDAILVGVAITTRGTRLVNALVHPAYRGLSIGRELVRQTGATEVRVKLNMSTGDPRGFYTALGFQPIGRAGKRGDIALMRLSGSPAKGRKAR